MNRISFLGLGMVTVGWIVLRNRASAKRAEVVYREASGGISRANHTFRFIKKRGRKTTYLDLSIQIWSDSTRRPGSCRR